MIKEGMKNEEMETEVVNDEDITIEGEEEMKENLFTKGKNFITGSSINFGWRCSGLCFRI